MKEGETKCPYNGGREWVCWIHQENGGSWKTFDSHATSVEGGGEDSILNNSMSGRWTCLKLDETVPNSTWASRIASGTRTQIIKRQRTMSGEREWVLHQSWECLCVEKYDISRIRNIDESGAQAGKKGGAECCPWEVLCKYTNKFLMRKNICLYFLASMQMERSFQVSTSSNESNFEGTTSKVEAGACMDDRIPIWQVAWPLFTCG